MNFKKIFLILLFFNLQNSNSFSIEPDIFVQSTVNRASTILSKNISKIEKINELKSNCKRNCRY
jgi:phospholipid transport system substrate-binding protein